MTETQQTLDEEKVNGVFTDLAAALSSNEPLPEPNVMTVNMQDWYLLADMKNGFNGGHTFLVNRETGERVDISGVTQSLSISGNVWSTPKIRLRFVAMPTVIMTALEDLMVSEAEEIPAEDREQFRKNAGV